MITANDYEWIHLVVVIADISFELGFLQVKSEVKHFGYFYLTDYLLFDR